jgi:hypothetical protein
MPRNLRINKKRKAILVSIASLIQAYGRVEESDQSFADKKILKEIETLLQKLE